MGSATTQAFNGKCPSMRDRRANALNANKRELSAMCIHKVIYYAVVFSTHRNERERNPSSFCCCCCLFSFCVQYCCFFYLLEHVVRLTWIAQIFKRSACTHICVFDKERNSRFLLMFFFLTARWWWSFVVVALFCAKWCFYATVYVNTHFRSRKEKDDTRLYSRQCAVHSYSYQ